MKNPTKTFNWIITILQNKHIPFAISGGLAAKSYGSPRQLNDIDIDVHDVDLEKLVEEVKPYITFGPARYKNERWDLQLIKLCHEGQDIDIGGCDNLKICDARTGIWEPCPTDFTDVTYRDIFGIIVPVTPKAELIAYKSMLQGDHQKIDIDAVANCKD